MFYPKLVDQLQQVSRVAVEIDACSFEHFQAHFVRFERPQTLFQKSSVRSTVSNNLLANLTTSLFKPGIVYNSSE